MDPEDERPEGPADALSPPPRDRRLSRNRSMLAALVVLALALVVFVVALALG